MSRDKQIEEMTHILHPFCDAACLDGCYSCVPYKNAEKLYNMGYRKASDVAREIFEEIENLLDNYHSACHPIGEIEAYTYYEGGLGDAIADLKKKYESEGADDDC